MKRIGLLFDTLRAPYDVAHIMQIAAALGNCDLYVSGNSIDTKHRKITSKVKSWKIKSLPEVTRFNSLEEAAEVLHAQDKYLVGTSPHATRDLYEVDITQRDPVLVFGTESTGLTSKKIELLDTMIKIPMDENCSFLTLPVAVSVAAYEFYRQIRRKNEKSRR
jgi:tRNA G18 (ribose-2'-O)-methylase SpoU